MKGAPGGAPFYNMKFPQILDNLQTHRAMTCCCFPLAHPRWEFVFQPIKAAYLNLIEPWWKIHHSLAFAGGRFES